MMRAAFLPAAFGQAPVVVRPPELPDDGGRRFPRTEGEAFRTASWRNPLEGPYHRPRWLLEAVRWALVVLAALALVGAQL